MNTKDLTMKPKYEDCITTMILIVQNLWSMRTDAQITDNQYMDILAMMDDIVYGLSEILANQKYE